MVKRGPHMRPQASEGEVQFCCHRAEECRRLSKTALTARAIKDYLDMEQRWLALARSYEFSESLSRFTGTQPKGRAAERIAEFTDKFGSTGTNSLITGLALWALMRVQCQTVRLQARGIVALRKSVWRWPPPSQLAISRTRFSRWRKSGNGWPINTKTVPRRSFYRLG